MDVRLGRTNGRVQIHLFISSSRPTISSYLPRVPSKYFRPGTERAAKVEDLFAAIAPRYDLINDLQSFGLHRYWKRKLLVLAAPQPGETALDVCCGTGDVAFALANAGALTTGFDFSAGMLEIAARRQAALDPSVAQRLTFRQGDALHLPFDDATFNLVTISYGLRNLADFDRGTRELTRVLTPHGRLVILDFGKPDQPLWRWVYFQYLRWICPWFGRLFCGDRDTHGYILDSLKAYPAQRGVAMKLEELGFQESRLIQLLGGMMSLNYGRKTLPLGTTTGLPQNPL